MGVYKIDQEKKTKHKHFSFTAGEHEMMLQVTKAYQRMMDMKTQNMTKTLVHAMKELGKRLNR